MLYYYCIKLAMYTPRSDIPIYHHSLGFSWWFLMVDVYGPPSRQPIHTHGDLMGIASISLDTELSSFMASSTTKRLGDRFFWGFGASTGTGAAGAASASAMAWSSDSDAKLGEPSSAASEARTSGTF